MTKFQKPILAFLFLLLLIIPSYAEKTLSPQSRFLSRALLSSPATGLSFMTPRNFRGAYDAKTGTFFLKNRGGLLLGIYGFSKATLDEVADMVNTAVKKLGMTLTLEEKENLDANTVIATFQTTSPQGKGIMVGITEIGKDNNALAIVGFGKAEKKEHIQKKLKRILAQVEWKKPEARTWQKKWAGKVLSHSSSAAPGSKTKITFCGDSSYTYQTKSESIQNSSSERHQGRWRLVANLVGETSLILNTTDGRTFLWTIEETKTGVQINGTQYQTVPGPSCNILRKD